MKILILLLALGVTWCRKLSPEIGNYPGIRGTAGADYPIYSNIPATSFSCLDQSYNGIYADPEAGCQVFHMCQPKGVVHSFLCPNGTIFNQMHFTCQWWFDVDCVASTSYYGLNEGIYKTPERTPEEEINSFRARKIDSNEGYNTLNTIDKTVRPITTKATRRPIPRLATLPPATQGPKPNAPFRRLNNLSPVSINRVTNRPFTRFVVRDPVPVTRNPYIVEPDNVVRTAPKVTPFRSFFRNTVTRRPASTFVVREPLGTLTIAGRSVTRSPFVVEPDKKIIRRPVAQMVVEDPAGGRKNGFIVNHEKWVPARVEQVKRPFGQKFSFDLPRTAVISRKEDLAEEVPLVIPRQKIQIVPIGLSREPQRLPIAEPPAQSFENILDFEPRKDGGVSRRQGKSEKIPDGIEDLLDFFPGPRRLR